MSLADFARDLLEPVVPLIERGEARHVQRIAQPRVFQNKVVVLTAVQPFVKTPEAVVELPTMSEGVEINEILVEQPFVIVRRALKERILC